MSDPVSYAFSLRRKDFSAFTFFTRPHFAIFVIFRTTYRVVVSFAISLFLESRLANRTFEGSVLAVCLLMIRQTVRSCTFEAAPLSRSFVDMLTHEVEDSVVVEVLVISHERMMKEIFAASLVRTHDLTI